MWRFKNVKWRHPQVKMSFYTKMVIHGLDDLGYILGEPWWLPGIHHNMNHVFCKLIWLNKKKKKDTTKWWIWPISKTSASWSWTIFFGGTQIKSTPKRSFENRLSPPHRLRGTIPQRSRSQVVPPKSGVCWLRFTYLTLLSSSIDTYKYHK